ncbi:hypothetical protein JYP52_23615 [Nitratireductor aquibiodomus]|uniref:hypothetical protein n=1 Tax=Nitratireductor aquibiodomus TaxID=204799 RepID=UPI0019D38FD0|nr:hypothetical protein [Nitratireductor aquibiodomus]MBN7764121.1 hypothetical protein [Nitratireductor aquibiodomus]
MSRYDFCHTIHDEKLGIGVVYDLECEIELSVELDAGVPMVSVDAVYVDGKNLFHGSALTKSIAVEIANAAENDEALKALAVSDEGFTYRGLGGNDPDGRYVRAL